MWHPTAKDLAVKYNGITQYILNKQLLDKHNAWSNLDKLKDTHVLKLTIYDLMKDTMDAKLLKSLAKDITEIEYELQDLWGFPRDRSFHRFWIAPGCSCPTMDNEDGYPNVSIINVCCRLHGID